MCHSWVTLFGGMAECVVPKIIHTSPTEGIFPKTPPTPLDIPIRLHTFPLKFLVSETPPPPGISNHYCVGSMDIFWNHTMTECH